jgi:aryl-alcohol dehydrogenase-like predicted oxidoreductase
MTEYRRVGNSGLSVSVVGLGCNNLGRSGTVTESQEGTDAVVHAALDAGITFFDVADTYGREPGLSETMLGRALGARRGDAIIGTKFGMDMRGARIPAVHHQGGGSLAAPARHGLDRPLPVPHPGPAHAHRRDALGPR